MRTAMCFFGAGAFGALAGIAYGSGESIWSVTGFSLIALVFVAAPAIDEVIK